MQDAPRTEQIDEQKHHTGGRVLGALGVLAGTNVLLNGKQLTGHGVQEVREALRTHIPAGRNAKAVLHSLRPASAAAVGTTMLGLGGAYALSGMRQFMDDRPNDGSSTGDFLYDHSIGKSLLGDNGKADAANAALGLGGLHVGELMRQDGKAMGTIEHQNAFFNKYSPSLFSPENARARRISRNALRAGGRLKSLMGVGTIGLGALNVGGAIAKAIERQRAKQHQEL